MPRRKENDNKKNESDKTKSEALKKAKRDARTQGGPVRVDYICAPDGGRCNFFLCRLFRRHRLPSNMHQPREIIKDKKEANRRIKTHLSQVDHGSTEHRVFINVFFEVANPYTYNGRETQYIVLQFHPGGHPQHNETRSHFHIRPAWISDGEFQYNDTATPDLYNFTPAEHYYYEVDDMNDYWLDEDLESGSCRPESRNRDDEDDNDPPPNASNSRESSKDRSRNGKRSQSRDASNSRESSQNRSTSHKRSQSRDRSRSKHSPIHNPNKCMCKYVMAASTATKYVVKKEAAKEGIKQASKYAGKSAAKKVPFVGAFVGLGFGAVRLLQGDPRGALGEVTSGAVSCVPVVGTMASVGIDVYLAARDLGSATSPDLICPKCGKIK